MVTNHILCQLLLFTKIITFCNAIQNNAPILYKTYSMINNKHIRERIYGKKLKYSIQLNGYNENKREHRESITELLEFWERSKSYSTDIYNINNESILFGKRTVRNILQEANVSSINETEELLGMTFLSALMDNKTLDVISILSQKNYKPILKTIFMNVGVVHLAVMRRNEKLVSLLLDAGANPYGRDQNGNTALHLAVLRGIGMVKAILNKDKTGINIVNNLGQSALYLSIVDREILQNLLNEGADPDVQEIEGKSPLHMATYAGLANIVSDLLKYKANPNLLDQRGSAAVHLAVLTCNHCLKAMLNYNQSIGNIKSQLGQTPLAIAALSNRTEEIKMLQEFDADPNISDIQTYTPLHISVYMNHIKCVHVLISNNKTDINSKNIDGETPIFISARHTYKEIFSMLLQAGADHTIGTVLRETTIHVIAAMGDIDLAELVISERKIDPNIQDVDGITPLYLAAEYAGYNMSHFLLANGADPNKPNFIGRTPLHIIALRGDVETAELFLNQSDVNINWLDMAGMTPIYLAVHHPRIVTLFLESGANPFLSSVSRWTAFHEAIKQGSLESLYLMVNKFKRGMNIKDRQGLSPLLVAAFLNNEDIMAFLLDEGADPFAKELYGSHVLNIATYSDIIYKKIIEQTDVRDLKVFIRQQNLLEHNSITMAAMNSNYEVFLELCNKAGITEKEIDEFRVLHHAAVGNSKDIVEYILNQTNISVDSLNEGGITPLMNSARHGAKESFAILLNHGADQSKISDQGVTLLHYGAIGGDLEIIETLDKGSMEDINARDSEGYTPLMYSVTNKRLEAVSFFLERKADPFAENIYRDDSIKMAVKSGSYSVLTRFSLTKYNYDSLLGLAMASKEHNVKFIKYLLSKSSIAEYPIFYIAALGSHIHLSEALASSVKDAFKLNVKFPNFMKEFLKDYEMLLNDLVENEENVGIPAHLEYLTPLDMTVLFFGDTRTISLILNNLEINITNLNNRRRMWNLVDFAMYCTKRQYKSGLISKSVLHFILSIDKRISWVRNDIGWSLAHKAAWMGYREVFGMLDSAKMDFREADTFGRTPLHIASSVGENYVVDQILLRNGLARARDGFGFTPLHLAVIYSKPRLFRRLSEVTSDIPAYLKRRFVQEEKVEGKGDTGYYMTILNLVDNGAQVDARDTAFGWTPLHWAANNGDIKKVAILLELGAGVNIPSRSGQTPMYLARVWGRKDVYQLLKTRGAIW